MFTARYGLELYIQIRLIIGHMINISALMLKNSSVGLQKSCIIGGVQNSCGIFNDAVSNSFYIGQTGRSG